MVEAAGTKSNQDSCDKHKLVSELAGCLHSQDVVSRLTRLSKKLAEVRASGSKIRKPKPQRQRPRRPGWVVKAVTQVMVDRAEPMRSKDIHRAVEELIGETVAWSSVKMALASNVSGPSPRFVRVARGRYVVVDQGV